MSVRPARQKKPIKIAALILVPLAFAWALGAAQAFAKDTALDKAEALSQAFADAFEKVKPSIVAGTCPRKRSRRAATAAGSCWTKRAGSL